MTPERRDRRHFGWNFRSIVAGLLLLTAFSLVAGQLVAIGHCAHDHEEQEHEHSECSLCQAALATKLTAPEPTLIVLAASFDYAAIPHQTAAPKSVFRGFHSRSRAPPRSVNAEV